METKVEVSTKKRFFDNLEEAAVFQQSEIDDLAVIVDSAFRAHQIKLFASEGSHGGEKWKELSEPYRNWKARKYRGRKILNGPGLAGRLSLKKSFTTKNVEHVAYGKRSETEASITVGSKNTKAAWHGPGDDHNRNLPVRDSMQHKETSIAKYWRLINEYYVDVKMKRVLNSLLSSRWVKKGN